MRKIIVYSSKHGAVEEVVKKIIQACPEVVSHNIVAGDVDIQEYDMVIIGTNVTAGQIDKHLKTFCNQPELVEKEVIVFVSGLMKDISEVISQNFSIELREKMRTFTVGGKLNFPEMNFFERNIIKMVNKKEKFIPVIDKNKCYDFFNYEIIQSLITTIKQGV